MNILVADDHAIVRLGLIEALKQLCHADHRFVEAEDAQQVLGVIASGVHLDLILLDLFMPRRFAWQDELRRLRAAAPATPLCILSASAEPAHIQAAAAAGVRAYLVKTLAVPEVIAVVRRVLNGETVFPDADGSATAAAGIDAAAGLTPRQRQILELLAAGATNREIADALGLTEDTVKRHIFNLCRRLGARNRLEAVAAAHAGGLLTRY